ncbi:MAG: sigma 54-interacting transcriptional regulator [Myxococcota bacterium]|nr:sigma 54-interacting transcriptional regulator [Myxococcota bacterium]
MQDRFILYVSNGNAAGTRLEWAPQQGPLLIGRDPSAALVLSDDHISAKHVSLSLTPEGLELTELGSTNGSRISRQGRILTIKPNLPVTLSEGDVLCLGDLETPVCIPVYHSAQAELQAERSRVVASTQIARIADFEARLSNDHRLLRALYDGMKRMNRLVELSEVIDAGTELCFAALPTATHVTLYLESEHHDDATRLVPVASRRRDGKHEAPRPLSRYLRARVIDEHSAIIAATSDVLGSKSLQQASVDAVLAVPLWIGERMMGILQLDRRASASSDSGSLLFSNADLESAVIVASQLILAIDHARLYARLRSAEEKLRSENRFLRQTEEASTFHMVGESEAMKRVLSLIEKVKDTHVPVCIIGETGTGKELVARAIHYRSSQRDKLFVAQNCAALPADLLESELFGYVRGAFTGADNDKKGLLEMADGGTVFLDEIGETSPAFQSKLLRFLQEGEFRPVGSVKTKRVHVRVISATNRNLEEEVAEGRFREDLFYRLNVFPIRMPALRDRASDIKRLAEHFMARYATDFGLAPMVFSTTALDMLESYKWPGNIRELQNEIQRILICGSKSIVEAEDLSPRIRTIEDLLKKAGDEPQSPLRTRLEAVERYLLIEALRDHDNNKTQTAKTLNLTREGLHKKLARLRIG